MSDYPPPPMATRKSRNRIHVRTVIGPPSLSWGRADARWSVAAAAYHRTMAFIQLTRDTGTVCKNGHPQSIREDYLRAHDGDHLTAQRGPTCWIAGCDGHTEYLQSEQQTRHKRADG
jgi:hypothetical protein